jgi:hypothetical protein
MQLITTNTSNPSRIFDFGLFASQAGVLGRFACCAVNEGVGEPVRRRDSVSVRLCAGGFAASTVGRPCRDH